MYPRVATYIFIITVGKGWRWQYLLLPAYSFVQSMIILPIAIGRYYKYARTQKSLGLLHYDMSHLTRKVRLGFKALNYAAASFVLFVAGLFTAEQTAYWYTHGHLMRMLFSFMR